MTAATRVVADRASVLAEIAAGSAERERAGQDPRVQIELLRDAGPVSYTHLTLPTIYSV